MQKSRCKRGRLLIARLGAAAALAVNLSASAEDVTDPAVPGSYDGMGGSQYGPYNGTPGAPANAVSNSGDPENSATALGGNGGGGD